MAHAPRCSSLCLEAHAHTCAALQEHENALRFFQRALQVDPTFTYAYTLAGHEYAANEDFEKGLSCYQNAVRLDPRHYNAWCAA
jgi:anaphase-promoting complex subunit 3